MRKIMNNIKYLRLIGWIVSVILGLILIGWTIFNRLFRIRLPRELPTEMTSYWQLFYILIFVSALINCIAIVYILLRKPTNTSNTWLTKLLTRIGEWYYYPYKTAYDALVFYILPSKVIMRLDGLLLDIGDYIFTKANNEDRFIILVCTEIIPTFIVATTLCIDVYYFGKFQYFYVALYLLIIPLAWKALLYMLKEIAQSNINTLKKYIRIDPSKSIKHDDGSVSGVMKYNNQVFFQKITYSNTQIWTCKVIEYCLL